MLGLSQGEGRWSRETEVDCYVGMEDECINGDIHGICHAEAVDMFCDDSFHPLLTATNWYMIKHVETQILY
jgi:hypothetical protein